MKGKEKKNTTRTLVIVIIVICLILLLIPLLYFYYLTKQTNFNNSEDDEIIRNETANEETLTGYRNIAIFGVDSRENDLERNTRSDTIMIASINQATNNVKLCSIYRDTYVNIPEHKFDKITHAYANGGYSLALSTINTNFDLNVTDYITVNFYAVAHVIDLLGGIELDIQPNELKWLNGYVRENNRVNGTNDPGLSSSGLQTVTGTQALAYSRIRYTTGGDFKRTERQRIVVDKIFEKAKTADIATLNEIITKMLPEIYTNISGSQILLLAKDIFNYTIIDSFGFPFEKKGAYLNKVSYVLPIDLTSNVIKLHQTLFDDTDYVPTDTVNEYSSYISSISP